jgi:hypothetical protein
VLAAQHRYETGLDKLEFTSAQVHAVCHFPCVGFFACLKQHPPKSSQCLDKTRATQTVCEIQVMHRRLKWHSNASTEMHLHCAQSAQVDVMRKELRALKPVLQKTVKETDVLMQQARLKCLCMPKLELVVSLAHVGHSVANNVEQSAHVRSQTLCSSEQATSDPSAQIAREKAEVVEPKKAIVDVEVKAADGKAQV